MLPGSLVTWYDSPEGKRPMSDETREQQRATALQMIREGQDTREISKKTGLPPGSIAAYKAHETMGSYGSLTEEVTEEIKEAVDATFGLERDLQRALRLNIEQLEAGLRVADGGTERTVPSGRIDITAEDQDGTTVVIELKVGEADRDAIAQVLSYMGDAADDSEKQVRGILVARDFSTRAISAARAVRIVELKKYSFKFSFESVTKRVVAGESGL
jgi:hypothetical protein